MNTKYVTKHLIELSSVFSIVRWFRFLFLIGIWFFIACLLFQVFMAGMAVFIRPAWWAMHILFAHAIGFMGIVLLIVAFLGRFPKTFLGLVGLLVFLVSIQYNTIRLSHIPNWSLSAAFHPVSAFFLFWVATVIAWKTWCIFKIDAVQGKPDLAKDEVAISLENHNETARSAKIS